MRNFRTGVAFASLMIAAPAMAQSGTAGYPPLVWYCLSGHHFSGDDDDKFCVSEPLGSNPRGYIEEPSVPPDDANDTPP
jgi:hypothetical protein